MENRRRFKEVVTLHRGFDLPKAKRTAGAFPVISSSGVNGTHSDMKAVRPGVVVGRSGNAGSVQYVDTDFWPLNTTLFVSDFHGNNPEYIYYLLKSMNLRQYATGTTVPTLNRNHLDDLVVYIPDIEEQKRVANILGSIDSKIQLNKKIDHNLLKLIEGLLRLVYFNSERVKRSPLIKLSEIVRTETNTFNPKKSKETMVNLFSMPAFDADHFPRLERVNNIKSNKNIVEPLAVLVSKMNPRVKRVWLPNTSADYLNVVSTEFIAFNSDTPEMQCFIYAVVNIIGYQEFLKSNVTGSTNSRQRTLPTVAYSYKIRYDPQEAEKFGQRLIDVVNQIKVNQQQNQYLARLRDLLLPRMLSGDVSLFHNEVVIEHG